MDTELANARTIKGVVVDAGHGGSDPGAVANGLKEKDFTLEAARYMYDRFKQLGIPVTITRDDDRTLTRDERVSTMVNSFGNGKDVLVLSNHINAGGGEGAEVYYALRDNGVLARSVLEEIGKAGQITRGTFQRRLPEDPSKDYYYIHRLTPNTTSLLLEYGFIDNPNDVKKLQSNLLNYVEAVVRAVAKYANVPYTPPTVEGGVVYVVKPGDTLWEIASRYNTTVGALKSVNNLASDVLQVGQILIIPEKTPGEETTGRYIVQRGDNLWGIANRYGTTVNALKAANNLTGDTLQVGQILIVPTENNGGNIGTITYTVERGDSLWGIANRYKTTVNAIKTANNLTSDTLQVGQTLRIPGTVSEERIYVVKPNDSLWRIANQYNVSIQDIIDANQLATTMLQVGQVLKIPSK